jgi:hypothetical protein
MLAPVIRQTTRRLFDQPVHSLAAVLILSLGLGLTTGSETILFGLYHRSLHFPTPQQLVRVEDAGRGTLGAVPEEDYAAWREAQTSFAELVAWYPVGVGGRAQ